MAKRNDGGAAGCEKGVRSRGTSSSLQSDEAARIEPVLDGFDCSDMERKLHENTIGDGDVEQNSDEQRVAPRCTGISGDLHLYVVRSVVKTEGEVECDDDRVEDGFRFPAAHHRLMFSGIPSTARVRLEIAQRRVCTSSLSSGKLRKKNPKSKTSTSS